jgi:hypothetical protein
MQAGNQDAVAIVTLVATIVAAFVGVIGLRLMWVIYKRQKADAERLRARDLDESSVRELSEKKRAFVQAVTVGTASYGRRAGAGATVTFFPDRDAPARDEARKREMAAVDAALRDLQAVDPKSPMTTAAEAVREKFWILFVNAEGGNHAARLEVLAESLAALDPTV